MKIGILNAGHPPEELAAGGEYDTYFRKLLGEDGFDYQAWDVDEGDFPQTVQDADGWLITGSKHGAYEPHDWIAPLEQFVRDCYAANVPMIGVCFGHQLMAQAMGGKVEKFSGGWSVGPVAYAMGAEKVTINAWHQDQVIKKPPMAKVFAETDFCAHAGLIYGDTFWTIQPHPEYDHDFIDGLITHRGKGVVPDAQLADAKAKQSLALDQTRMAEHMRAFFMKERT